MSSTNQTLNFGFSPVAGIQWVETWGRDDLDFLQMEGFSPVAGIQWVETANIAQCGVIRGVSVPLPGFSGLRHRGIATRRYIVLGVSVPLPGFSGLRPDRHAIDSGIVQKFQSRCRDSVG